MVDTAQLTDIEIAATLLVAMGIAFLYLIHWTRRRSRALSEEPLPSRAELQDRAFNQITIAKAAADRLGRDGVDVSGPRQLIESAEAARRRGDPDTALGLAKSAQATLIRLKDGGIAAAPTGRVADPLLPDAPAVMPSSWGATATPASVTSPDAAAPRLPPNKAESRFQLTLLREDLGRSPSGGTPSSDVDEARALADQSQSAFDRGDYTESLRLGLKGRRRLGGRLDTLAPSLATVVEAPGPVSGSGDAPSSEEHCGTCGQPLRSNDKFCRGCGASKEAAHCAACGEPLSSNDRFCGVCGAPIRT